MIIDYRMNKVFENALPLFFFRELARPAMDWIKIWFYDKYMVLHRTACLYVLAHRLTHTATAGQQAITTSCNTTTDRFTQAKVDD